jgi:hypothetical protein
MDVRGVLGVPEDRLKAVVAFFLVPLFVRFAAERFVLLLCVLCVLFTAQAAS